MGDYPNEKAEQNSRRTRSLHQSRNGGHLRLAYRIVISVQPDGDSWKVVVAQEGSVDDADRREMVEQIAARLKAEYDLKG
jgi:hypothetical protein